MDIKCNLYPNIHPFAWLKPLLASVSIYDGQMPPHVNERGQWATILSDFGQSKYLLPSYVRFSSHGIGMMFAMVSKGSCNIWIKR